MIDGDSRPRGMIDDRRSGNLNATTGTTWELLSDRVMGGVSEGSLTAFSIDGRRALELTGDVRLENNGGFVQMALDLAPDGGVVDALAWQGLALTIRGNGETYGLHLRTAAVSRPWQSYRQPFIATPEWRTLHLPFSDLVPHRLTAPFDPRTLRRLGLVAIGRAFAAELALAELRIY